VPFLILLATLAALGSGARPVAGSPAPVCSPTPLAQPAPVATSGVVLTRGGSSVAYRTEAGLLRVGGTDALDVRLDTEPAAGPDQPSASLSYVYYAAAGASRPLVFVWDGGPGTSTRSMLMGSFGPVIHGDPTGPSVRPNPDTLLDKADLVFVDAPGTGFGHLEGCAPERSFYGVDVDADAFRRFIERFLRTHHRQGSPVALFGESYGTLRAALVVGRLQRAGTPVRAVVMLSQLLALDAWSDGASSNPGTENGFYLTLPSFAATAWAHGRVAHVGSLEARQREVERFALDEYAPALLQGSALSFARKRAIAARLAAYTGLSAQTWLDADLRIEAHRFRDLLEADQGRIVGREDTRVDGPAPKVRGTAVDDDPTLQAGRAARLAAFDSYVRGALGLGDRRFTPYIDGPDISWDMHHATDAGAWPDTFVNAGPDLVAAMKSDPRMRVLIVGGYFDLAAPYLGGRYLADQLELPDAIRRNLELAEYPASHSAYEDAPVRRAMHDRMAAIIAP
jgi:carboxypeptidase C (cathepsin A)